MRIVNSCHLVAAKRGFFWGRKASANIAAPLIEKDEEMKIMQYRGRIEEFNANAHKFESYLRGEESDQTSSSDRSLIEGKCTAEGSLRFKERAIGKGIPAKNFRKPFELPNETSPDLFLSTVGMGTYLGKPDDEDDFDQYVALKYLM